MSEQILELFGEEGLFPQWQEASDAQDWDYICWLSDVGLQETADLMFVSTWQLVINTMKKVT